MATERRRRNYPLLAGMVLLAVAYSGAMAYFHTITGTNRWDGIIGVVLGLYICSHPVANLLDLLLFGGRHAPSGSRWAMVVWILANLAVVGVGWFVISIGTTHITIPLP
jgi:hypothetical protein